MTDALGRYWTGRSAREQRLLAIMFALLAAVILWFAIIAPLRNARTDARERLDQATQISGQVSSAAESLRRASRNAPRALGMSLSVAVGASATEAGFAPARLDPQGNGAVLITLSSAKSTALFGWLDALGKRGIFVDKIAVRANGDGTVSCDATLKLRRP